MPSLRSLNMLPLASSRPRAETPLISGHTRIACLIAALALVAACSSRADADAVILLRLNYETGDFRQWTAVQAVAGGAKIVRRPVRQGRRAARFVVRPGDNPINASGERAEVLRRTGEKEGTTSWWAWSTYFPSGFHANSGSWNVFTQWHHTGHLCPPPVSFQVNNSRSPAKLKLRVWGGRLDTSTCDNSSRRGWNFATLRRGRWYDFVFHVRWSAKPSIGFVNLWVNGRVRVPKTHLATLYEGQGIASVKQGFYRGPSSLTTTIYHDGMRRFRP